MRLFKANKQRYFSTSYLEKREKNLDNIKILPEYIQREKFYKFLNSDEIYTTYGNKTFLNDTDLNKDDVKLLLEASYSTFLLHVESRIAASIGEGYYTIGPCGEENLSAIGLALRADDSVALHYRHLSTQIARHRKSGISLKSIIDDRARAHVVSSLDPVTGGVHCALGGGKYDYLVTSTLASQSCPAVGRALGNTLAHHLKIKKPQFSNDFISYISVGDGSTHNSHFLSALNLSDFVRSRNFKVPVLFAISDNDLCISLKGKNWINNHLIQRLESRFPVFTCNGNDIIDIYNTSEQAINHCRYKSQPTVIIYKNLTRRFGHAATDRQNAYLNHHEINNMTNMSNNLKQITNLAIQDNLFSSKQILKLFKSIHEQIDISFDDAVNEPKNDNRQTLINRLSQPLIKVKAQHNDQFSNIHSIDLYKDIATKGGEVMRKHMTSVIDEILHKYKNLVYIGEDVEHGGYYLVTTNLKQKYPYRISDFPPDETSLLGTGIGYAQAGLIPIIEIPYAKYLDCGSDMFWEAAISNWLSNGKQPNGLFIRLQGFGRGVFGGNFHTHNMLTMPPGIDVICYSNGYDYVKGFRYAIEQVKHGRIVMFVDCTYLLNMRHAIVKNSDNLWRRNYPTHQDDMLTFDDIIIYENKKQQKKRLNNKKASGIVLISYGDGILSCLEAQQQLISTNQYHPDEISIIDCPLLNRVPNGLQQVITKYKKVLFVDICKEGQHPFASHITFLKKFIT